MPQVENAEIEELETATDAIEQEVGSGSDGVADAKTMADAMEEAIGKPVEERQGEEDDELDDDLAAKGKPSAENQEPGEAEPGKAEAEQEGEAKAAEEEFKLEGDVSDKTRKTFDRLIGKLKETDEKFTTTTAELEQTRGHLDTLRETINSTGAQPEEVAQLLDYARQLHSGNLEGAWEILERERTNLAKYLGKSAAGVDILADFPDLKEQLDMGEITEEAAAELATYRRAKQAQAEVQQQQAQRAQQAGQSQQQMAEEVEEARTQLNALGASFRSMDRNFELKMEKMLPIIAQIRQTTPPRMWAAAFQKAYLELPTPKPAPKKHEQPLSGSSLKSGGHGVPQTLEDAMNLGLSRAGNPE